MGGDGVAIAPEGVGAEVECVVFFVRGDVPAFGDARAGGAGFVDAAEAFEQGGGDAHADLVGDDGGVEGFGFGAVDEDEVGAVAGGAAGGEGEAEEGEGGEARHAGV